MGNHDGQTERANPLRGVVQRLGLRRVGRRLQQHPLRTRRPDRERAQVGVREAIHVARGDLPAADHVEWHTLVRELRPQARDPSRQLVQPLDVGHMRRGYDRRRPVVDRRARERDGIRERGRAVVDAREGVEVDVGASDARVMPAVGRGESETAARVALFQHDAAAVRERERDRRVGLQVVAHGLPHEARAAGIDAQ